MRLPYGLYEKLRNGEREGESVTICLDDGENRAMANVNDFSMSHAVVVPGEPTDYCIEIEVDHIDMAD